MNDMYNTVRLSDVQTCELHAELIKREGVSAVFLGPKDEITKTVRGPAWVIVNQD
ncbi:MAG: BC1881 family protein [Paracoccaceae bacterium]